jgi:hypothetical protein
MVREIRLDEVAESVAAADASSDDSAMAQMSIRGE